jgi:hypothetical protein
MKHLPRAPFEEQEVDRVQVRRVISRTNAIKTMFMGVAFPPNPEHNFDGKVTIKCISRTRQLLRDHCTKFHNDHHINQLLIVGDWHQVYDDETYTANEILVLIVNYYELDKDVSQALCLRYNTYQGQQQQRRTITMRLHETLEEIQITEEHGNVRRLTIDDLNISCFYPQGSFIEEDVTCNSQFMLDTMPTIGAQIRQRMPWIPQETPIYLILDNAGGHGTRAAIEEYTRRLRNTFNVIIKFQPACSPEVNALDLGIWMSLQSSVKRRHRNRRQDIEALATTVQEPWADLPADTIQRVFN